MQPDVCNGCGYCVVGCPFGVIDRMEDDGRAWKCTLCYDRLKDEMEPACAKSCPTDSIQFGEVAELREKAAARVSRNCMSAALPEAYLYGCDEAGQPGTEGLNAFFLLVDKPEVYNLPPDPVAPAKKVAQGWAAMAVASLGILAAAAGAVISARNTDTDDPDGLTDPTYYDKPVIKPPVWIWAVPAYFYVGGVAGAAMALALAGQVFGGRKLRHFEERCRWIGAVGGGIGTALLIHDLGRPERFLFMLRVFRATSPMSIGSWVLAAATPLSAGSALLTLRQRPALPARLGRRHRRRNSRVTVGDLHGRADLQHRCTRVAGGPPYSAAALRCLVDGRTRLAAGFIVTERSRADGEHRSSARSAE